MRVPSAGEAARSTVGSLLGGGALTVASRLLDGRQPTMGDATGVQGNPGDPSGNAVKTLQRVAGMGASGVAAIKAAAVSSSVMPYLIAAAVILIVLIVVVALVMALVVALAGQSGAVARCLQPALPAESSGSAAPEGSDPGAAPGAGASGGTSGGSSSGAAAGASAVRPGYAMPSGFDSSQQQRNAEIIIGVGESMRMPPKAWQIAIATAMQESTLRILANPRYPETMEHPNKQGEGTNADSVGLFQQRPEMGWGAPRQLMNPAFTAKAFYLRLQDVQGWEQLPLTEAAQRVQRSAYPDAYAGYEDEALTTVDAIDPAAAAVIAASDLATAGGVAGGCVSFAGMPGTPQPYTGGPTGMVTVATLQDGRSSGPVTRATEHAIYQIQLAFPVDWPHFGCFRNGDSGFHPLGRACDYAPGVLERMPSEAERELGWRLANWLRIHHEALKVTQIIWDGRIWTTANPRDEPGQWGRHYSDSSACPSGVPDSGDCIRELHYDHVHVSFGM